MIDQITEILIFYNLVDQIRMSQKERAAAPLDHFFMIKLVIIGNALMSDSCCKKKNIMPES